MNEKQANKFMNGKGYKGLLKLVKTEPDKTALAMLDVLAKLTESNWNLTASLICNVVLLFLLYA